MTDHRSTQLLELTTEIVVAYLRVNNLAPAQIVALIGSTYSALAQAGAATPEHVKPVAQTPAVSIRKSITDEAIICLEDGLPFRSLKRHLRTKFGLSPDQYREKWGLPADYPMVSPGYSAKRSALAKAHGLGRAEPKPRRPVSHAPLIKPVQTRSSSQSEGGGGQQTI